MFPRVVFTQQKARKKNKAALPFRSLDVRFPSSFQQNFPSSVRTTVTNGRAHGDHNRETLHLLSRAVMNPDYFESVTQSQSSEPSRGKCQDLPSTLFCDRLEYARGSSVTTSRMFPFHSPKVKRIYRGKRQSTREYLGVRRSAPCGEVNPSYAESSKSDFVHGNPAAVSVDMR